ncbi:MAG: S-layer homology domain-containing protein [Tissierellia bacterium]|nr:S-layer homology domain-containing protein [Tissierellia bacterium]
MKKYFPFLYVFLLLYLFPFSIFAKDFSDTQEHWAKEYIQWATREGILHGYPDGKFRPNDMVSQGEFYKMVNRFGHFTKTSSVDFKDVNPKQWYYKEVTIAVGTGYLKDSSEELEADKELLRNEGARIISQIYNLKPEPYKADIFLDSKLMVNPESIGALVNLNIINGYPDGNFRPLKGITRGEAAKLLFLCKDKLGSPSKPKEEVISSPGYLEHDPHLETEVVELPEFYYRDLSSPNPVTDKVPPKGQLHYLGWMFESKIVLPANIPQGTSEEVTKILLNQHFGQGDKGPVIEFFFYEDGKTYSVKAPVQDWKLEKEPVITETGPQYLAFPDYDLEGNLPIEQKDVYAIYIILPSIQPTP